MQTSLVDQSAISSLSEIGTLTGNTDYLVSIFDTFKSSFAKDLSEIQSRYMQQDYARVKLLSHRMKSSARTVGAKALADMFADIEKQLSTENPDLVQLKQLLGQSEVVFQESKLALSEFYKS